MMLGMMIFDQWWWLMLPGFLLGLYAQFKVQSAYSRYLEVPASSGLTGAGNITVNTTTTGSSGINAAIR